MTHLPGLESTLNTQHKAQVGKLWSPARDGNLVRLHQTPNVWGKKMDSSGVMPGTKASVGALADAIKAVIKGATRLVDITSLDPPRGATPDGVFYDAIESGIASLADTKSKQGKVTVRFLFGFPPGKAAGRAPHHERFKAKLAKFTRKKKNPPRIIYGVYAATSTTGPYFNHSKIVAADGHAVVGGHNLYDADYNQYPPVHDVSVEVFGPAAIDAQNFAAYLWEYGKVATPGTWTIGLGRLMNNTTTAITAWQLVGDKWQEISQKDYEKLMGDGAYATWDDSYKPKNPPKDTFKAKILTVGRVGGWTSGTWGAQNASDFMKKYLFENAGTSIKVCHQDLIAMELSDKVGLLERGKHTTCEQLAAALHRKQDLTVQVVVSAPYGAGQMDVYTNVPNGPQTAANYIMYYARAWFSGSAKLMPLWKRLLVAPFHFTSTDKLPGGHYFWPQSDQVHACEGALTTVGYPKSVGNHSKVMIIDDTTLVVGSDNHYPSPLAEINFVLEGEVVGEFVKQYWNELWKYSEPHAVQQWSRSGVTSSE